ncbi:RNA polymerase-binding protein DksA [Tepidicella baoligensis]|uniref:RNA polymerase-binding protein DksA n=1 Tax=Tepidicella baoligensis TaxID=2707016 RepID=UPI0031B59309
MKDTAKSPPATQRTAAGKSPARSSKAADAQAAPVKTSALRAGSEVKVAAVNKRAERAAMQAQMSQSVAPSHHPDAAKATFTPSQERDMTPISPAPIKKDPKLANNWKTKPVDQLTDADVLAMPDSEYMNEVQLAYFRRKLEQLKRDILINAGETTEHLREETVVVPDPADRATIEEEHALELRTRDRERKLLKKIEQSIARIDSGDYGYCDETGEPIGVGRLLARPTASLSIEAQQRRELKQKLFGD